MQPAPARFGFLAKQQSLACLGCELLTFNYSRFPKVS